MAMLKLIAVVLGLVGVINAATPEVTGTYAPSLGGRCNINLKAWGYVDAGPNQVRSAYMKVNGLTYFDSFNGNYDYRGFNFVQVDMNTCKASNFAHFDTWADAANSNPLALYVNNIPDGTHILGVTSDDGFEKIQDSARNALKSIGVDVTGLKYGDKVLFHAVKGHPEKAVAKIGKNGQASVFYDETAPTCDMCMNGGVVKFNEDKTGIYCQCPKKYVGFFCQDLNDLCKD